MLKYDKPKAEGGAKPKGRHFQQSNSTQKAIFKVLTTGLEDKVFDFGKEKHAAYSVKNFEAIDK